MPSLKAVLQRLLLQGGNARVFWPLLRSRATIFMLHRFHAPEIGVDGHDVQTLRTALDELRRQRYELLPLATVLENLEAGRKSGRPVVAFTIDDGYLDHASVAAPVFAEFDCPVTTFVTTGFIDGRLWFWWDRIEYVFENTSCSSLEIAVGNSTARYEWHSDLERREAQRHFVGLCKVATEPEKCEAVMLLASAAQVELPEVPPARYAPMKWSDLRRCEAMTMSFGPHTVTHPILSRTSDSQSRYELTESWNRLRAEAKNPVPIYCYPNGQVEDFGEREMKILSELGFRGAVTGLMGYATAEEIRGHESARYRVRRFAYADSVSECLLLVSGAERLKQIVRREV